MDVAAQSRLALAAQSREAADRLHDLVGLTSTDLPPGARTSLARDIRQISLQLLDLAVLADLAAGATWAQIAESLHLPETFTRDRYEALLPAWADPANPPADGAADDHVLGLVADDDPTGTAAMLDQWWQRHAEPWQAIDDAPVSRALAGA